MTNQPTTVPPASNAPPLTLHDVTFSYPLGEAVVASVTAALPAGRLCALIGPNAAGKSTLLRLILGHLTPSQGEVLLCGQCVSAMSATGRAALMSYVPQRAGACFAFTVREVVAMGRFALPHDDAAVDVAIESCDLSKLRGRVFSELSIGQQQRVLLARAMAQSAGQGRVMLLDEPGSAMDLWHVHQMMRTLRSQCDRGLAALVVVHDLNLAARYADDVWLLEEGRLRAAGSWQQVLRPEVLEGVYRVGLTPATVAGSDRPVFVVDPGGPTTGA